MRSASCKKSISFRFFWRIHMKNKHKPKTQNEMGHAKKRNALRLHVIGYTQIKESMRRFDKNKCVFAQYKRVLRHEEVFF
jgi:hypothetical protein